MTRPKKNKLTFIFSLVKNLLIMIVLTSFVLGISFFVKFFATSDVHGIFAKISPTLARFNLTSDQAEKVASDIFSRVSQTGPEINLEAVAQVSASNKTDNDVNFKVAVLADSHGDYDSLQKALLTIKDRNIKTAIFLGDYTDLGVIEELKRAKTTMDNSDVEYYSLPGDHDLWKSVGPQNFVDVFGSNYFSIVLNGVKFVGLDNSANYTTISPEQLDWFKHELESSDFVFLSQPLYSPSLNVVMGVVNGQENQNVRLQAVELLTMIREAGVKAVIAGDQHMSSQHIDPEKPGLMHIVVGASTKERNLQTPRFGVLTLFKNGDYKFEDVLLK